jgi:hypothetical protein
LRRERFACAECIRLLPTVTGGYPECTLLNCACSFCGVSRPLAGPVTPEQCQVIIDSSRGKRIVAGGDGVLRAHHLVGKHRFGKYVHVLDVANVGATEGEPWFTCRVQGEMPGPSDIYPAFPLSAIEPYVMTRESLLARNAALSAEIRAYPAAEKLRLAADFLDKGMAKQAAACATAALSEIVGQLS